MSVPVACTLESTEAPAETAKVLFVLFLCDAVIY
jgi:hypothetical protein